MKQDIDTTFNTVLKLLCQAVSEKKDTYYYMKALIRLKELNGNRLSDQMYNDLERANAAVPWITQKLGCSYSSRLAFR